VNDKHEPHSEFIEKLEWQIGREVRRRNRTPPEPSWTARLRAAPRLALAGLILASMSVGGGVVAAAYQAQGTAQRDVPTSVFERRVQLARQRLAISEEQQQATERRVSLGAASREDLLDWQAKVAEAKAEVKSRELELEEIRITGHNPQSQISSPLVSGRDFVNERLTVAMSVPEAALELEQSRLREAEKRYSLGVTEHLEVETARARAVEAEAALEAVRRKAAIRQQFLNRKLNAVAADLRVMEVEAALRQKSLGSQVELARKELQAATKKVELGTGQKVQQAEAALRMQLLQTELAKSELDLAMVRRQIEQRGGRE
jgi:outer membrane protein TolC